MPGYLSDKTKYGGGEKYTHSVLLCLHILVIHYHVYTTHIKQPQQMIIAQLKPSSLKTQHQASAMVLKGQYKDQWLTSLCPNM